VYPWNETSREAGVPRVRLYILLDRGVGGDAIERAIYTGKTHLFVVALFSESRFYSCFAQMTMGMGKERED
jgi:hypothetical protein